MGWLLFPILCRNKVALSLVRRETCWRIHQLLIIMQSIAYRLLDYTNHFLPTFYRFNNTLLRRHDQWYDISRLSFEILGTAKRLVRALLYGWSFVLKQVCIHILDLAYIMDYLLYQPVLAPYTYSPGPVRSCGCRKTEKFRPRSYSLEGPWIESRPCICKRNPSSDSADDILVSFQIK